MKFVDPAVRPKAVAPALDNVPQELREVRQWVLWKYEYSTEKNVWAKIPYTFMGRRASSTDSKTWTDFDRARQTLEKDPAYDGLGFVFSEDTPYVGIDLDGCLTEVDGTLEIAPWAKEVVEQAASFTELSPSMTGLHIIGRAERKPPSAKGTWKGGDCEVYGKERYFTVSARLWRDKKEIGDVTHVVSKISSEIKQEAQAKAVERSTDRRLDRALKDPQIKKLFDGDTADYDGDHSRADMALVSKLASYAGYQEDVLDAMFRKSQLMRDKWDSKHGVGTYGEITLAKALEGKTPSVLQSSTDTKEDRSTRRYTIDRLWDKVMTFREDGGARGFHPGWDNLERYYRPTLGSLSVVVGVPSSGKSTWIDCLAYNMAKRHGWRTTMASFESLPIERHINNLIQIHLQKPTFKFMPGHATAAEMERAGEEINEWFNFILPEDDELTVEHLLQFVQDDIEDYGVKGFVLDPFTEIELTGEADVKTIEKTLRKIQQFTRSRELHTWLAVHPTKGGETFKQEAKGSRPTLYSSAGAAHFRNKADYGLVIHRWDDDKVNIWVEKVRNDSTGGHGVVEFTYDVTQRNYLEIKEDKWRE